METGRTPNLTARELHPPGHRVRRHGPGAFNQLVLLVLAPLIAASALAGEAEFKQLSAAAIRHRVIGKVVTDDAHWADHFLPNGAVRGHSLGRRYTGTWTIEDGQLCVKRGAKPSPGECFEVWMSGREIEYRRGSVPSASGVLRDHE